MSYGPDPKYVYMGDQIHRCLYRFQSLMTLRNKEVTKLNENYDSDALHEDVKKKLLKGADEYINCLTGTYKG